MSYLEFLAEPYNLAFLGIALLGAASSLVGRRAGRRTSAATAFLLSAAVIGLTLTGGVHDLRLGDPGRRFPLILALSLALAVPAAWAVLAVRRRLFPPTRRVALTERGQEGEVARVVRPVAEQPGSGRAQRHDGEGTMHLIRCHSPGGRIGFGKRVRLTEYDDETGSYLARPL